MKIIISSLAMEDLIKSINNLYSEDTPVENTNFKEELYVTVTEMIKFYLDMYTCYIDINSFNELFPLYKGFIDSIENVANERVFQNLLEYGILDIKVINKSSLLIEIEEKYNGSFR